MINVKTILELNELEKFNFENISNKYFNFHLDSIQKQIQKQPVQSFEYLNNCLRIHYKNTDVEYVAYNDNNILSLSKYFNKQYLVKEIYLPIKFYTEDILYDFLDTKYSKFKKFFKVNRRRIIDYYDNFHLKTLPYHINSPNYNIGDEIVYFYLVAQKSDLKSVESIYSKLIHIDFSDSDVVIIAITMNYKKFFNLIKLKNIFPAKIKTIGIIVSEDRSILDKTFLNKYLKGFNEINEIINFDIYKSKFF